jgi:1-deoxy-D-xylulose-5-phosphate reductoisomerase
MEGTAACALNAANEINVASFLKDEIGFLDIALCNEKVMMGIKNRLKPELNDFIEVDREAREMAQKINKG